ncbi:MAG: hypothetical protein M0Z84_01500 [Gammaproteobacteria bacterium]|nr:hypothetical protein [Gammaproteobacteria bacterium]
MKYLKDQAGVMDADGSEDTLGAMLLVEQQLSDVLERLRACQAESNPLGAADLELDAGRLLVELGRGEEAWDRGRKAFDLFVSQEAWEGAVQACDVMFQSDRPESLAALGQGLWLTITFPMDPELSVALLQHVVDETPPDSDGAAVAAVVARYLVDIRAEGRQREDLEFYTSQMLATVARRHSGIDDQEGFDTWFRRLELNDPALFLPRMRNVVDVLVQNEWWIDREDLQSRLPVH